MFGGVHTLSGARTQGQGSGTGQKLPRGAARVGNSTGRQTPLKRKPGGRVRRAGAFQGEGHVMTDDIKESSFKKVAGSKTGAAKCSSAAVSRLLLAQGKPVPSREKLFEKHLAARLKPKSLKRIREDTTSEEEEEETDELDTTTDDGSAPKKKVVKGKARAIIPDSDSDSDVEIIQSGKGKPCSKEVQDYKDLISNLQDSDIDSDSIDD